MKDQNKWKKEFIKDRKQGKKMSTRYLTQPNA